MTTLQIAAVVLTGVVTPALWVTSFRHLRVVRYARCLAHIDALEQELGLVPPVRARRANARDAYERWASNLSGCADCNASGWKRS